MTFAPKIKKADIAKIYLIKDDSFYKYVGATFQPFKKNKIEART